MLRYATRIDNAMASAVNARRLRLFAARSARLTSAFRKNAPPEGVIETGEKRNDGDVIQKRKIAADDEKDLKAHQQHAGDVARVPRPE